MSKIIIDNRSNTSDMVALEMVKRVVASGRISGEGKSYCFATVFSCGVDVLARRNKASDTFVVLDSRKESPND